MSRLTLDTQRAVEIGDEAADDREAQAGSARLGRVEVIEGARQLRGRHPATRVGDDEPHAGASGLGRERNGTDARLETVDRVGDEIVEDAPQQYRVSEHRWERVG
jgi:hypothetical protein